MARIRSIKPEFWTSAQVLECSLNARLMFLGMWNFADDYGRMPFSPKSIKAQVFPADELSLETIRGMILELSTNGLVMIYAVDGKEYLEITGWKHQRIDKPQPAKYPAPFQERSENNPRTIPPDKIGEDKKGKKDICAVAKATRPNRDFETFKKSYPRRKGANPWKPALLLFEKAVRAGTPPETINRAAEAYGTECQRNGIIDTEKVAQAQTWLRQERYSDYVQPNGAAVVPIFDVRKHLA